MKAFFEKIGVRELRLTTIGVAVVVATTLSVALLVPESRTLLATNAAIEVLQSASQDGSALEDQLEEAARRIEELRFQLYGDMADLPDKQVEAYIIGRLQEISWGANIGLMAVEPVLGEKVQIFQELLFKVRVVGKYDDLYQWLWDVRTNLGYVVVKEYSVSRNNADDEEPMLLADLSLASYRAVD